MQPWQPGRGQRVLDEDHKLIYTHAISRLATVFNSKDHYIHQKPNRHQGKHTKQYKKQLIAKCKTPWQAPSHRWVPHRSGYQCGACGVRVHQALTVQVLEEHHNADCPQLSIEEPEPDSPHQPMPKKQTRQQVIKKLLQQQQEEAPPKHQHEFDETAGYLRCVKCGANVHKRSNEQLFQAFVQGQCLDQPYTATHEGHTSHALRQKGSKVTCTQCGLSLHLDAQQRLILTGAIKKPCKGSGISGSPPLTEIFRKQAAQASQQKSPEDSTSGTSQTTQPAPQVVQETSKKPRLQHQHHAESQEPNLKGPGPTPRRLHFPTELDQQAQGSSTGHETQPKGSLEQSTDH